MVGADGRLQRDGSLLYVVLFGPVTMTPIVRRKEELFTSTVAATGRRYNVVINANLYSLTATGYTDVLFGSDPVAASETQIIGQVIINGRVVAGSAAPQRFYIAQINDGKGSRFQAGKGDPPQGASVRAAVGGFGPLLVSRLPFGVGNLYRPGHQGPAQGQPPASAAPWLMQRNSATLAEVEGRPRSTGKVVVAYCPRPEALLVAVQPNGTAPGQEYRYIVASLARAGFTDAVFGDGSDSAMLYMDGRFVARPGQDKDESNTVGLGFRRVPRPQAAR